MRDIQLSKRAAKQLKLLAKNEPKIAQTVKAKILILANPDLTADFTATLSGHSEYSKFRAGKYRVIFRYSENDTLLIDLIEKRETVYRTFQQLQK